MIFNCGSLFEPVLQDLHDLLPQQDVLFVNGFVVMIMAEQSVVIFCSFPYLLQEIREPVRLVVAAPHEGDAGGSAVGDEALLQHDVSSCFMIWGGISTSFRKCVGFMPPG